MKVLALALFALAVFGTNADVADDVRDEIGKILEQIPEPAVDVHDLKYEFTVLVLQHIEVDVNDVVLKGIKDLDIKQLDYDESTGRLDYDLTFGDIEADVDFELDLSGLINFEHHPTVKVSLTDLKLAGFAVVDTAATPNQLTDFKLLVTLGGAKVELTNILNDDELTDTLTSVLNESLTSIVDNIAEVLEPAVSPIVQSAINIILRHTDE